MTVSRPGGVKAGDDLPVLLWIFGGGFELGSTAMYDGAHVVQSGVELGKPVIFAQMNYRVAGFGFLPGKEYAMHPSRLSVQALTDCCDTESSRMGVPTSVCSTRGSLWNGFLTIFGPSVRSPTIPTAFFLPASWSSAADETLGGDPNKVTIWGQSAGSISVFDQLIAKDGDNTYKGKQLFRGAIMSSGSAIPADPVDCPKGQAVYDSVVAKAGCAGEADTLECLRGVDYEVSV